MIENPQHVVIAGAGLAGAKTAEALREQGFTGTVTLVGREPLPPYERPPLSKGYLAGEAKFDDALVHPEAWYGEHDIDLRTGAGVSAVHRDTHEVELDDGSRLPYDRLVLATGSAPRVLPLDGADAAGVHYLRTRADSDALRGTFGEGRRLVIIGAGWIGLEVAAAARGAGTAVTIVAPAELPLLHVIGREIAPVFADLHREHGVEFRLGAEVEAITVDAAGEATGVRLVGGETITADAVVVGIGAAPELSLAEQAGLEIDNGVLVDGALRSSDPEIYAVGDLANQLHSVLGSRIRVEHWATALKQPATAAASILGEEADYTDLPYFFSDQYDLGLEYVGHATAGSYNQVVVRGDLAGREFVAFWLDDAHRVMAAMNVNVWDVQDDLKALIAGGKSVEPERLADPSVAYSALA